MLFDPVVKKPIGGEVCEAIQEDNKFVGWYDATLQADMWLSLKHVSPENAAMLLCQINPNDKTADPSAITSDETNPDDFNLLLHTFKDEERLHTLNHWHDIASKKGLKYHSWINIYKRELTTDFIHNAEPSDEKPWLIVNPNDPFPSQPWYIPARYFARKLVINDSTLLIKRNLLANKVSQSLFKAGVFGRTKNKALDAGTILKAFNNINLS